MRTVILAGELGAKFGTEWQLDVRTPAEAIRAINANCPGFFAHLVESEKRGVGYRVQLGDAPLPTEAFHLPFGKETFHIVPEITGAKSGSGGILAGVALIAASFIPGLNAAAWAGISMSSVLSNIGMSLLLGGVSQMLVGTPKSNVDAPPAATAGQTLPSYFFNGPTGTAGQGNPVPIGYGRVLVSGLPVSAAISSDNVQIY